MIGRKTRKRKTPNRRTLKFRQRSLRQRIFRRYSVADMSGIISQADGTVVFSDGTIGFPIVNEMEVLYSRQILTQHELNIGSWGLNPVQTTEDEMLSRFMESLDSQNGTSIGDFREMDQKLALLDEARNNLSKLQFIELFKQVLTNPDIYGWMERNRPVTDVKLLQTGIPVPVDGNLIGEVYNQPLTPAKYVSKDFHDHFDYDDYETDYDTDSGYRSRTRALKLVQRRLDDSKRGQLNLELAAYADALHDFGNKRRLGDFLSDDQKEAITSVVTQMTDRAYSGTKTFKPEDPLKSFLKIKNMVEDKVLNKGFSCKCENRDLIQNMLNSLIISPEQLLRDAGGARAILKRLGFQPRTTAPFERAFDPIGPDSSNERRVINYGDIIRRSGMTGISSYLSVYVGESEENILLDPPQGTNNPGVIQLLSRYFNPGRMIGNKASVPTVATEIDNVISRKRSDIKKWNWEDVEYVWSLLALKRAGDQGQAEWVRYMNDPSHPERNRGVPYFFETGDYLASTYALINDINLITSFTDAGIPYFYIRNLSDYLTNKVAYDLLDKDMLETEVYIGTFMDSVGEWVDRVTWFNRFRENVSIEIRGSTNEDIDRVEYLTNKGKDVSSIKWILKFMYETPGFVDTMFTFVRDMNTISEARVQKRIGLLATYIRNILTANAVTGNYHRNEMEAFSSVIDTFFTSLDRLRVMGFIPYLPPKLARFIQDLGFIVFDYTLPYLEEMNGRIKEVFRQFGYINGGYEGFQSVFSSLVNGMRVMSLLRP